MIDTGEFGDNTEDAFNDLFGNPNDKKSALTYGVFCLASSMTSLIIYILTNKYVFVTSSYQYFYSHFATFTIGGMGWVSFMFFDSDLTRNIFRKALWVSVMGPYFAHWYGTTMFMLTGNNSYVNSKGDYKSTSFGNIMFWVTALLQLCLTLAEMLV